MAQARTSGLLRRRRLLDDPALLWVEDAPHLFSADPLLQDVAIRPLDQNMIRTDQARNDALAKAPVAAPALADALQHALCRTKSQVRVILAGETGVGAVLRDAAGPYSRRQPLAKLRPLGELRERLDDASLQCRREGVLLD